MTRRSRIIISASALMLVIIGTVVYFGIIQSPSGDTGVVIAAAGDIACDPAYPTFNNGAGSINDCHEKATSDVIGQIKPVAVLALGDIQYVHGTASNYAASYNPTWGRYKDITYPAIGNHEGGEGGTNKAYFDYFGSRAGDRTKGYYSYDLGAWHVVVLNSNCGEYSFNGSHDMCEKGSDQEIWLQQDLAAHPNECTLAYFHVPRFASGLDQHNDANSDHTLVYLWDDLYASGVDVILNGHAHEYERFAPMNPAGQSDPERGIREFVVGTGGDNDDNRFGAVVPNSEVRINNSFGVLQMTLHNSSYDWKFVNDGSPGATNNDSGTASCH